MFCLEKEGRGGCCRDQKELFEVIYSVKNRRRIQALKDVFRARKRRDEKQLYESRKLLRRYKATQVAYNLQSATFPCLPFRFTLRSLLVRLPAPIFYHGTSSWHRASLRLSQRIYDRPERYPNLMDSQFTVRETRFR